MSIEEHLLDRPAWIETLVEVVVEAMTPLGFIGPLGYRWWEPANLNNAFDGWQIAVFPTPNELAGGKDDGCKFVSGFNLDVGRIINGLTEVRGVAWNSPTRYNGELDGPELSIRGKFAGKDVWLRLFNIPPSDERCSYVVNQDTGDVKEKVH